MPRIPSAVLIGIALNLTFAATHARGEPVDPDVALRLEYGTALAMSGDLAGAERAFAALLGSEPGEAAACCNLGNVSLLRGDAPAARTLYDRSLRLRPDDGGVLLNRAVARMLLGDGAGSREDARRAMILTGGRPAALELMGIDTGGNDGLGDEIDGAATLSDEDVRALLAAAESAIPDTSPGPADSAEADSPPPAWRPGAARAGGEADLAPVLHWKP